MGLVKPKPGESVESLIRRFNKQVAAEEIIQEFKKKEYYQKPALKRKEKKYEIERKFARRRLLKNRPTQPRRALGRI